MTIDPPPSPTDELRADTTDAGPPVERWLVIVTAAAVVVGTALRFAPRPDLWLDEALTVNISTLPLGDIGEALRRDGHPPLYYYLLHLWTSIGGSSDWWVRALSGVISLLSLPLIYLAGRRLAERAQAGPLGSKRTGLIAVAVMAMLPYAIRYGSEARMYSLAITLVAGGYVLADDLLEARSTGTRRLCVAAGAALVTGALLWTHYWSMWLLAAVGLLALFLAVKGSSAPRRTGARLLVGSLVVGGVLFLPWLSSLLYQTEHTGTPWGKPFGPVEVATVAIQDFSGDALTSYLAVALVMLGLVATVVAIGSKQWVALGERIQPRSRVEIGLLIATLAIGWAAATASANTFSSRYGAVVFPMYVLCITAGVAVIRSPRATAIVLVALLVLSSYVATSNLIEGRTQAGEIAERILEQPGGADAVVLACPDQIGVALQRALTNRGFSTDVIPYPTAGDPRFVDWVDYAERNDGADPEAFAQQVLSDLPADASVLVAAMPGYETFDNQCEQLIAQVGATRPQVDFVEPDETGESMGLWVFGPAT